MGHHGTIKSKRLKELFPNDKLRILRDKLSAERFRQLKAARKGRQALTEEEIGLLRKMLE
jgi:hypothetical protein